MSSPVAGNGQSGPRYLITGACGFIGSTLIQHLNGRGITDIVAIDKLVNANLCGLQITMFLHYSQPLTPAIMKGGDVLIHLGACTDTQETDAKFVMEHNFSYSTQLITAAIERGCRVIYASSAGVYGNEDYFSDSEDLADFKHLKPATIYAESKKRLDAWKLTQRMPCAALRFFNVWGERERLKGRMESIVSKRYADISAGMTIPLYRHPLRPLSRDFIYVKDVVKVIERMAAHQVDGIFNVGTGSSITWDTLITTYATVLGVVPAIRFIDMPTERGDNYQYYSKSDSRKLLGLTCMQGFSFMPLDGALSDFVQERKRRLASDASL
jgi:ADP-L-glycero-D-manno-heptose 6-epimerase